MYVIRYDGVDGVNRQYRGGGSWSFKKRLDDVEPFETAEAALTAFYTSGFSREAYTIIGVEEEGAEGEFLEADGDGNFYIYGLNCNKWFGEGRWQWESEEPVPVRLQSRDGEPFGGPVRIYTEPPSKKLVEGEPI